MRIQLRWCAAALVLSVGCGGGSPSGSSSVAAPASAAGTQVQGRVMADGAPVGSAWLVVGAPGGGEGPELDPASLESAADGSFALSLPRGKWEVTAVGEDGRRAQVALDVGAAAPAPFDLVLGGDPDQLGLDLAQLGPAEGGE